MRPIFINYPPFSQLGNDGKFSGFDIDIANAICAGMKAGRILVVQEWDGMKPVLNAKKFNMVVASVSITEDRKRNADFSDSCCDIPSTWIGKTGSCKTVDAAALMSKKIIVACNTPRAACVLGNFKDSAVLQVAKEAEVTMSARASCWGVPRTGGGVGMVMRRGEDALKSKVNALVKNITVIGTCKTINDNCFDVSINGE